MRSPCRGMRLRYARKDLLRVVQVSPAEGVVRDVHARHEGQDVHAEDDGERRHVPILAPRAVRAEFYFSPQGRMLAVWSGTPSQVNQPSLQQAWPDGFKDQASA